MSNSTPTEYSYKPLTGVRDDKYEANEIRLDKNVDN